GYMNAWARVLSDLIVVQRSLRVIGDINTGPLAGVNSVPAQRGIGTSRDLHARLLVGEDLVVVDHSHAALINIYAALLTIVNAIAAQNRIAALGYKHVGQCVREDLVVLQCS